MFPPLTSLLAALDGPTHSLASATLIWGATVVSASRLCVWADAQSVTHLARQTPGSTVQPLPPPDDALMRLLPRRYDMAHLPDAALGLLAVGYGAAVAMFSASLETGSAHLRLLLLVDAALKTMRVTAIISTLTGLACPNAAQTQNSWNLSSGTKHDLMFSGHTQFGTLLMIFTIHLAQQQQQQQQQQYGALCSAIVSAAAASATVLNGLLQIVVGDHYTVDVLMAWFVTIPWAVLCLQNYG